MRRFKLIEAVKLTDVSFQIARTSADFIFICKANSCKDVAEYLGIGYEDMSGNETEPEKWIRLIIIPRTILS